MSLEQISLSRDHPYRNYERNSKRTVSRQVNGGCVDLIAGAETFSKISVVRVQTVWGATSAAAEKKNEEKATKNEDGD